MFFFLFELYFVEDVEEECYKIDVIILNLLLFINLFKWYF